MSATNTWTLTVSNLLQNWGLQQYAEHFEREDVDIEALLALEPSNNSLTESLIPLGGKRAILLKKLKEFQLINSDTTNVPMSFYEEQSGFAMQVNYCEQEDNILSEINENNSNLQKTLSTPQEEANSDDKENVSFCNETEKRSNFQTLDPVKEKCESDLLLMNIEGDKERPSKRTRLDVVQTQEVLLDLHQLDLSAYLSESNTGRLIILKHRDQVLDDQVRKKLVEIIIWKLMETPVAVRYLDENQIQKVPTLKNHHFDILSSKIVELFPKESKETYYIPPKAEGPDRKIARGKLVDKYRNWLSSLSNLGLLTRKSKKKR